MHTLVSIAIAVFIIAQFVPKGQAFLSTGKGALATVAVSAVAILMMVPGILMGSVVELLFSGIWGYFAYQRLPQAKDYLKSVLRLPRR